MLSHHQERETKTAPKKMNMPLDTRQTRRAVYKDEEDSMGKAVLMIQNTPPAMVITRNLGSLDGQAKGEVAENKKG